MEYVRFLLQINHGRAFVAKYYCKIEISIQNLSLGYYSVHFRKENLRSLNTQMNLEK